MRQHLRRTYPFCLVALVLLPVTAGAQQASPPQARDLTGKTLEELMAIEVESVVGATKQEQFVTEAPASVTIVTARDIEIFGWRTLADVLRNIRGLHTTYDREYSHLGVRGFGRAGDYNNRVLVLVDGYRVNDSSTDSVQLGSDFPLDLALAERIEIIRGPGSALYGNAAFFAVVNIVTKRGLQVGGTDATAEAGSFGGFRGRVSYGWADANNHDVLLSASGLHRDGPDSLYFPEFDSPATNNGRVENGDADDTLNMFASARLGRWRLQSAFAARDKLVPTASWGTAFNDRRYSNHSQDGWVSVSRESSVGAATLTSQAYFDFGSFDGNFPQARFPITIAVSSASQTIGGEASVRLRVGARHRVTLGLEQRTDLLSTIARAETAVVQDRQNTSYGVGGYAQDEITLSPRLTAILGARYDWWSVRGSAGRPRVGLVYRPSYDTALKLLYGEAYRAPNFVENDIAYEGLKSANHQLRPESLRTTEIVFERYVRGRVRLGANAYYTHIADLIGQTQDASGALVHANTNAVRAMGLELEAESRWASGFLMRGSATLQDADVVQQDDILSNAPHRLANLQVAVPVWRRQLTLASDTNYVSWHRTLALNRLPGHWLSNLTLTCRPVASRLLLGASLYNVFNTTYAHPVGAEFVQDSIVQDGRTFAVRAGVRF